MPSGNGSPAAPTPTVPDAARLREIAVRADVDPRSVASFFKDAPLRASVYRRIEAAVAALEKEEAQAKLNSDAQREYQDRMLRAKAAGCSDALATIAATNRWELPVGMRIG